MAQNPLSSLETLFFLSGILYLFYFLINPTGSLADVLQVLYTFTFIIFVVIGLVVVALFDLLNFIIMFINSNFHFQLATIGTGCLRTQIVPTVNNILYSIFSVFPSNILPAQYPNGVSALPVCS